MLWILGYQKDGTQEDSCSGDVLALMLCRLLSREMGAQEDSCPDYMLKAEECLRAEEERVVHYLHASTKVKLLRAVETELLAKYETRLLEKEHSGAAALLRDDKARPPHTPLHAAPQQCICHHVTCHALQSPLTWMRPLGIQGNH